MPNLASSLKEEIARVARKELKSDLEALRKTSAHYRSEIAALKRQLAGLEKSLKSLGKGSARTKAADKTEDAPEGVKLRFRADGFKAKREALELTADAAGKFFNVSGQTIYLWESKRTSPRASHMPAIAAFRKLGKKQAHAILETL
jgi:DNA-binding transcriptional regulator YiaG